MKSYSILLSKRLDNGRITLFHGIDGNPHCSIADHIQGKIVGMFLKVQDTVFCCCFLQLGNELRRVLIHYMVEVLQDIEVERGSDHFSVLMPPAPIARKKTRSKPRM